MTLLTDSNVYYTIKSIIGLSLIVRGYRMKNTYMYSFLVFSVFMVAGSMIASENNADLQYDTILNDGLDTKLGKQKNEIFLYLAHGMLRPDSYAFPKTKIYALNNQKIEPVYHNDSNDSDANYILKVLRKDRHSNDSKKQWTLKALKKDRYSNDSEKLVEKMKTQNAVYCDCVETEPSENGEPAYEVGAIVLNTRNLNHCQTLRAQIKKRNLEKINQENTSDQQ